MKLLPGRWGVILIGLIIFTDEEVRGADWMFYSTTDSFTFYYDKDSINRLSKDIFKVWVKIQAKEKGINYMMEKMGGIYKDYSHGMTLYEINCAEKKIRTLSAIFYSKKGEVLGSSSLSTEWDFIPPESLGEDLYKALCK